MPNEINGTCNNIKNLSFKLMSLDFFNLVLIPVICVFGMITNLLNIIIFSNIKMKKPTFKLMLAMSINDLIYLALCFPLSIFFCKNCRIKFTDEYSIYLLYIDDYFTSSQAIFCILIEIVLSVDRYKIITSKKYVQKFSYNPEIILVGIISALYFLPVIFFQIRYECSPNIVILEYKSSLFRSLSLILTMIRLILGVILLSIINFINLAKFSKMFREKALRKNEPKRATLYDIKEEMTNQPSQTTIPMDNLKELKASRNMALLVLFTCGKYFDCTNYNCLKIYMSEPYCKT